VSFAPSNSPPPPSLPDTVPRQYLYLSTTCFLPQANPPPTSPHPRNRTLSSSSYSISAPLPLTPLSAALITTIYAEHADEDGFLYITYNGENTFGSAL
jgi:hypothetical protein